MTDQRRLSELLDRLDPVDRAVLELSKRRGMSDEAIAAAMRSTPEAVTRRIRNAVDRVTVWTGGSTSDDRRAVDRGLDLLLSADAGAVAAPSARASGATATRRQTASGRGTAARGTSPARSGGSAPAPSPTLAGAHGETETRPSWLVVVAMAIVLALIGAAIGYGLSAIAQQGAALPGTTPTVHLLA